MRYNYYNHKGGLSLDLMSNPKEYRQYTKEEKEKGNYLSKTFRDKLKEDETKPYHRK